MKARFRIVGFEEGRPVRSQGSANMRLVCLTDSDEKLVIWGEEGKETKNIEKVLQHGLPCQVECDYIAPTETFKSKFGHKYWVPQNHKLEVI